MEGPRAFEAFFESYLMTLGNKFIDSTSCIEYTNQTDVLLDLMKSISERVSVSNRTVPLTAEMQKDLQSVNNLIVQQMNAKCGVHIDAHVSAHMQTTIKVANMLQIGGSAPMMIQFTDGLDASFISNDAKADTTVQPKVYGSELPQPDLTIEPKVFTEQPPPVPLFNPVVQATLIAIPSEYKAIIDGQMAGVFATRNKWADFGRRMALVNQALVLTTDTRAHTSPISEVYIAIGAFAVCLLISYAVLKKAN